MEKVASGPREASHPHLKSLSLLQPEGPFLSPPPPGSEGWGQPGDHQGRAKPLVFLCQMLSTAFLILGVFAIFDTDNLGVPKGLEPIAIGLLIILLTSSMALNSGCAMNPARDLGPRLFTYLAGWGSEVFT